jgi:hypothetical protein
VRVGAACSRPCSPAWASSPSGVVRGSTWQ